MRKREGEFLFYRGKLTQAVSHGAFGLGIYPTASSSSSSSSSFLLLPSSTALLSSFLLGKLQSTLH